MRRTLAILALSMLGGVLSDRDLFAGGQKHSGNRNNNGNHNHKSLHNFKPQFSLGNKVLTGNKNGTGFIADPIRRPLKNTSAGNTKPTQGNFIADPLRLPTGNPTRVTPIVRDHTLPNPNATVPPPRSRYDSINGGGLGLDLNPFDFQAPLQFQQQVDKRTNPYPGGGRSGGHKQPWTPNTTGPANRSPVKP